MFAVLAYDIVCGYRLVLLALVLMRLVVVVLMLHIAPNLVAE